MTKPSTSRGGKALAVGLILEGSQAEAIRQNGDAEPVAIGSQKHDDPHWSLQRARQQRSLH
jgi:2,4-dienoyl-CoA reductase-like NADH-dependent reductase (Old Yellow Enzyme family)